jgi:hypothetical protein
MGDERETRIGTIEGEGKRGIEKGDGREKERQVGKISRKRKRKSGRKKGKDRIEEGG